MSACKRFKTLLLAQLLASGGEKTACFLVYPVAVVTFSALETVVSP